MRTVGGVLGIPEASGDPDAWDEIAGECGVVAAGLNQVALQVRAVGEADGWRGEAAEAFGARMRAESATIATGRAAWFEARGICVDQADALRDALAQVERCVEDAHDLDARRGSWTRSAEEADRARVDALARSTHAAGRASQADAHGLPTAQSHRDEQLREAGVAEGHAERAASDRRRAAECEEHLEDVRARARRAVARLEDEEDAARARLRAIGDAAPSVDALYGIAGASIGHAVAPALVRPVPTRTAPPATEAPEDEDGGGFWDGVKDGWGGLVDTAESLAVLYGATRLVADPELRRRGLRLAWDANERLVRHPVESLKDATYRPFADAHRKGGWDYLAGFGGLEAVSAAVTRGRGRALGTGGPTPPRAAATALGELRNDARWRHAIPPGTTPETARFNPRTGVLRPEGFGAVLGRGAKLDAHEGFQRHEFRLHLPTKETARENWKQNYGQLRDAMSQGQPIRDLSFDDDRGEFLNAERYILRSRGWRDNVTPGYWMPPG